MGGMVELWMLTSRKSPEKDLVWEEMRRGFGNIGKKREEYFGMGGMGDRK